MKSLLTKSHSIRSFRNLKSAVNYASFDDNLYKLLTEAENRELFKFTILEKYFPKASNSYLNQKQYDIFQQHELEILNEDPEIYIQKIKSIEASMDEEEIEEERFIRNGAFREQVLKSYQYSCSISGLSITSTANISIIDACHIMPFSESYNDHITNGIALCPNLHRAYDRGLLTFNDDYTVKISNISNEIISLKTEFGNTDSENMIYPAIVVFSGIIILLIAGYIKLKNYKIAQPDEKI